MRIALLALVLLTQGCAYSLSDGSPERVPAGPIVHTEGALPVRARCELADVRNSLRESGTMAPLTIPNTFPQTEATRARFRSLVSDSRLFDEVVDLDAPRTGAPEVRLVMSGQLRRLPEPTTGMYVLGITGMFVPVLTPLWLLYYDGEGAVEVDWTLECRGGESLVEYSTRTRIVCEAQLFGLDMYDNYLGEALAMSQVEAERTLVSKLVRDPKGQERIRRFAQGGPVVVRAPAPAAPKAPPAAPPRRPTGPGETYVLSVGVNDYADARITSLRCAEQDARSVYAFYATERRSPATADRVRVVLGEEATRAGILRAIREHLVQKATREEDTVVLFFAGHGFADATTSYIAGRDARLDALPETAISQAALQDLLDQVVARRRVVLVDACRSGGLAGLRGIGGVTVRPPPSGPERATIVVAASGANELSTEDPLLGQGVFTVALLRALRGEADADGDDRVTGAELEGFLAREVPVLATRAKGRQTPVVDATTLGRELALTR